MARRPLAALVLLLAAPCGAEVVVGFKQTLAAAFMERPGEPLPDLTPQRELAVAAGAAKEFDELMVFAEKARFIQAGRAPGDSVAVYQDMVRYAAKGLGVADPEKAVPLYDKRTRPAGYTGGGPDSLALRVAILRAVAQNVSADRAAIIRRRADVTARQLDALVRGEAGDSEAAFRSVEPRGALAADMPVARTYEAAPAAALTPEQLASLPPRALPQALPITDPPKPAPQATGAAWAYETVLAYLDTDRIAALGEAAMKNFRGFVGRCYEEFKKTLIWAGGFFSSKVKAPSQVGIDGIGSGSAYMFGMMNEQQLAARGLRKVQPSTIAWAPANDNLEGFMLVWGPGCNGFNAEHGHVEYILSRRRIPSMPKAAQDYLKPRLAADELIVKSDGVTGRSVRTLSRYSAEPQIKTNVPAGVNRRTGRMTYRAQACLTVLAPVAMP